MLSKKRALWLLTAVAAFGAAVCIAAFVWVLRRADPEATSSALLGERDWDVVRIQADDRAKHDFGADRVFFKNGSSVDHIGFELKYLGQLTSPDGSPIVVFSGRTCADCDAGVSFFIYSPKSNQVGTYAYPAGEVRSAPEDEISGEKGEPELYYSGRAFLGQCLLGEKAQWKGIVAFGKYRDQSGAWEAAVQFYEFEPDGAFDGKVIYQNLPDISEAFKRVGEGVCSEMPARNYTD